MDIKEFKTEILPFKNKLYRFALRIVGNVAEAEDVVQEVFIKLWNQRESLHQYSNLEAWCIRMTKIYPLTKPVQSITKWDLFRKVLMFPPILQVPTKWRRRRIRCSE